MSGTGKKNKKQTTGITKVAELETALQKKFHKVK